MIQIRFFVSSIIFALISFSVISQVPLSFNYQAVLRNDAGEIMASEDVIIEVALLQGGVDGTEVFSENHPVQTNDYGLVNLKIGSVNSMEDVDWEAGDMYIQISVDGVLMGTSPLLSVPYALQAQSSADSFSGDYNDLANTPDLGSFVGVTDPQDGDLVFFNGDTWLVISIGSEGQVLTVVEGTPQWADLPEDGNGDEPGTVSDVDGNVYPTVLIGSQEWMAENLRTTKYANGDEIATGLDNAQWVATTNGAYAVFPHANVEGIDSDEQMIEYYGRLYNWYAVNDDRGLCPTGWKVPDYNDWDILNAFLSSEGHTNQEGNVLKDCRQVNSPLGGDCNTTVHPRWNDDTFNDNYGTDLYGFSGLPAGYRGNNGFYFAMGFLGLYWTSTESGDNTAWHRHLSVNGSILNIDNIHQKISGFNIRCIRE